MRPDVAVAGRLAVAALCLGLLGLASGTASAQYGWRDRAAQILPWENSRVRVSHIAVDPGSSLPDDEGVGRVLVYLTAGPDGTVPAEAVWQPAGEKDVRNRGRLRLEALAIELKDVAGVPRGETPPETLVVTREMQVSTLVDNPRVLVTKHRYAPHTVYAPLHFHTEDVLVVYLRGGHSWPLARSSDVGWIGGWTRGWDASRVRRGDVEVIPANTFHTLGNAGGDPIEFLLIFPR
jgi:hypothetical protein